jgi:hypothetical protein
VIPAGPMNLHCAFAQGRQALPGVYHIWVDLGQALHAVQTVCRLGYEYL